VELIEAYSNKVYLRDQYSDVRKRLQPLPFRSPEPAPAVRARPLKRRIIGAEVDDIIAKYRSGISTNELMREHHVVKRTISALLKANGVALRRQGFTSEQTREAADLYQVGRSLAWIANRFGGISPTTVARALRKQGVSLRPRPGAR
jgi:hypothetical protein